MQADSSMSKIKILRIIARLNIGGPAIHTILLTEGLDKSVFEGILVSGTEEKDEGNMSYLAQEKGVSPVIIPELGRALNIRDDFVAFWKIFRLIKKEKPDIIHTHTAKAGTLGRLAGMFYNLLSAFSLQPSAKKKCILVHTFHGHVLHSYFGKIKSLLFIWIERFLAIFTDKIIAVSENLREELIGLKIVDPKKIITIPLGLELGKYLKIEKNGLGEGRACRSVGIIGRLVTVKNHRMFLDAVRKLKDSLEFEQKVKFLIVGDGPLRRGLENYAGSLGIKENVTFTGWLKDLESLYSELDVVALTSLNEGTPVALIEAQSAGCPCVATRVGGVADVVEEGNSGYLVPSGDTEGFVKRLKELLPNRELMQAMGRYGRDRVRDRFSKGRLVRDIETLYKQLCE